MPKDPPPAVVINVEKAKNPAYEKSDAGHVRSSLPGSKIKVLKPGGRELFSVPAPGTKLYIDSTGIAQIWIYNQTSVPLALNIKQGRDDLDDVVKTNKTFKVPLGSRVTAST